MSYNVRIVEPNVIRAKTSMSDTLYKKKLVGRSDVTRRSTDLMAVFL